jgi:hypothetical protein
MMIDPTLTEPGPWVCPPEPERLPRVTEILMKSGLVPGAHFTDFSRERGTAVHMACQYHDEGQLDESSVDEAVAPYLVQYKRFLFESGATVTSVEKEIVNEEWGFIGHFDRVMVINGVEYLVDIKTGQPQPWHSLQLAAYRSVAGKQLRRAGLYLSPIGYKFIEHKGVTDWEVFRSALVLYNWRKKCGMLS